MEERKVKLEMELDRDSFQSTCFLLGLKLTDEMWEKMIEEPVKLGFEEMGGNVVKSKMTFAALAISKVLRDMEKNSGNKLQDLLDGMTR
ncbi:hypothetical protein [uncultured Butyricimonas sp.]|uniref:hypothetical protein n=1 Tax=uncultured Butyricimonas sp. TaxID=1268785 RepID=UPI0026DCA420|nr:hypothetical protein [uncultured Butyricimonas sp.]